MNTNNICFVGNTAKQCRLGLFQDSDFAGSLEDTKSTSGGTLCILGNHTFVPISWMCKKQNFSFTQFNRIRNHLFGRWIEIRRDSCSRFMGSGCSVLETRLRLLRDRGDPLSLTRIKDLKGRPTY